SRQRQRRTDDRLLARRAEPFLRRRELLPANALGVEGALQEGVERAGERHRAVELEPLLGGDRRAQLVAPEKAAEQLLQALEAPLRRRRLADSRPQLLVGPARRAFPPRRR